MGVSGIDTELVVFLIVGYWPLILGGIILFVLVLRGHERVAMAVGGAVVLLQAWIWGLFA